MSPAAEISREKLLMKLEDLIDYYDDRDQPGTYAIKAELREIQDAIEENLDDIIQAELEEWHRDQQALREPVTEQLRAYAAQIRKRQDIQGDWQTIMDGIARSLEIVAETIEDRVDDEIACAITQGKTETEGGDD